MAAADAATVSGPIAGGGRWRNALIGAASALAMFLAALDFSVNVALPEMAADLNADLQSVQWALVVFMGIRASLVLGAGSFADRFGLRRVYLWGGMAYLVSMFCIALSPDLASVVGFRVLHGIGTACMYAVAPAIAANLFPPHRRGLSMGFTTANQALGMVGGTIGAGLLVGWMGWEMVFWGRVPFMVAALMLAWFFLDRDPPVSREGPAFDLTGTLTLAAGLICLIIGTRLGREIGWVRLAGADAAGAGAVHAGLFLANRANRPLAGAAPLAVSQSRIRRVRFLLRIGVPCRLCRLVHLPLLRGRTPSDAARRRWGR